MQIELFKIQNTLYDYIDWITPKLLALENWLVDTWSEFQLDPRGIELAVL